MGGATRLFVLLTTPFPLLHPRPGLLRLFRHPRLLHSSVVPISTTSHHLSSSDTSPHRLGYTIKASGQLHTQRSTVRDDHFGDPAGLSQSSQASVPWPEWSNLVERLAFSGYFVQNSARDNELMDSESFPDEFVRAVSACLAFARDEPNILGLLSRINIEAVVATGSAFIFRNGQDSARRMRAYLSNQDSNVPESDKAHTIDLMRFLLSHVSNCLVSSEMSIDYNKEAVESSVRYLLNELSNLSSSTAESNLSGSVQNQFPGRYGQAPPSRPRPSGQNIEMKRGDWICPRCSFMNFARNMKCLECEEARPKRELSGGEWECPQCDFFNYARNKACLRCDCKRPGEISFSSTTSSMSASGSTNKVDVDSRLAANSEKADRWFSKISQQDNTNTSDLNNDEDFPEIMPLRKGVNRFVVSTRKTPLERRLANADYRRNLGNDGIPKDNENATLDTKVSRTLDEILGRSSDNKSTGNIPAPKGNNSSYVPLPSDTFSKKPENEKPLETEYKEEKQSETWFKRVSELEDVKDVASGVLDEDFPVRKGDNRFMVNQKKDRSLTSPMYKRKIATEQASNTNYVPFVPFPPDYFKKDKQQSDEAETKQPTSGVPPVSISQEKSQRPEIPPRPENPPRPPPTNGNFRSSPSPEMENRNVGEGWTGKSLEGSAVKEGPDPLDMSEEAKAERWYKRVAQIKDISELANIPDEDFPSIMPMRKGVNRFVVSKRKTPLERRLTSPQYRRNLPVVTSDPPVKKENDSESC